MSKLSDKVKKYVEIGFGNKHTADAFVAEIESWSSGSGAVDSVNGQTGVIELDATDIPYDNSSSDLSATDVQDAIDELKDITARGDVEAIYVDASDGDDINGTGSILYPVQTLNKAVSLVTNPASYYIIRLGPGTYTGAQVNWPPNADLQGSGPSSQVQNPISYVAAPGSETGFNMSMVAIANMLTLDFTDAAVALPTLYDGTFNITRVDTLGQGPWAVRINDSNIGDATFNGNNLLSNCLFLNTCILETTAILYASDCIIGIQMELEGASTLALSGCSVLGAINGTTIGMDTPTVITDASSLNGATLNGVTVQFSANTQYINYSPTTPGDWATPPTSTQDALDRIADRLVNGGTGPL